MPTVGKTFVDTSAIYALMVSQDAKHSEAREIFAALERREAQLVTSSYVRLETISVLQTRFGLTIVRRFVDGLGALLETVWVERDEHERAVRGLLAADRRRVSLTDWTSFEIMRDHGIEEAFAFDSDFEAQGFRLATP